MGWLWDLGVGSRFADLGVLALGLNDLGFGVALGSWGFSSTKHARLQHGDF